MIQLSLLLGILAFAAPDPYLVESKVQLDLDNALSKMIPHELYLVQIHTDVVTKSERKLIEGESIQEPQVVEDDPANEEPMPGYIPEPEPFSAKKHGPRVRQVFRVVDTPELQMVHVLVNFDDTVALDTMNRARAFIQSYLREGYANKSTFVFAQVPMLKPPKPSVAPTPTPTPVEFDDEDMEEDGFEYPKAPLPPPPPVKPEPTWLDKVWEAKWFCLAAFGALLYFILHWRSLSVRAMKKKFPQPLAPHPLENLLRILIPGHNLAKEPEKGKAGSTDGAGGTKTPATAEELDEEAAKHKRRDKMLDKFLMFSKAFAPYYRTLSAEQKDELYGLLKGPTMDGLMTGLGFPKPKSEVPEPGNPEEVFEKHERDFAEYLNARDWQAKQFFGFLSELSEEQLVSLVNHETPVAVCAMLRFMKPQQSASILEALPAGRRLEILSAVPQVQTTPFT
ncbi:MAG: hypothetical protein HYR96_07355, partial [Deltaproteobacteria bacterium]|nr:hypothetical protein [Deltaproteobacteria bacterium]